MRILFQTRIDYIDIPGGDTIQMLKTKEYLEKLGLTIDINTNFNIDLSHYDLVHLFNIMRPFETYLYIKNAKQQDKKVILSSIFWDFEEYNLKGRNSIILKLLHKYLSHFFVEKLKYFLRKKIFFKNKKEFVAFIFKNYKSVLRSVDLFLPNSVMEGDLLKRFIGPEIRFEVVVNAVDKNKFYLINKGERKKDLITVARIDPRKNILTLVKAIKNTPYKLDVFGHTAPNHKKYYSKIIKEKSLNTKLHGYIGYEKLPFLYNQYKMHILPSWLETPGLSQLEAAACGCNIITTDRGSTKEYFGDMAFYCNPDSVNSINNAIIEALDKKKKAKDMSEFILENYTWEKAAKQTLKVYESILNE